MERAGFESNWRFFRVPEDSQIEELLEKCRVSSVLMAEEPKTVVLAALVLGEDPCREERHQIGLSVSEYGVLVAAGVMEKGVLDQGVHDGFLDVGGGKDGEEMRAAGFGGERVGILK